MAHLSTHVLDLSRGTPAGDLAIDLYRIENGGARRQLASARTNRDGRTGQPLLTDLSAGIYELVFHANQYFQLPEPAFLSEVIIRFGVADPNVNHHVPLLLSPFGYSTYRGS